jgi:hypothetical protein
VLKQIRYAWRQYKLERADALCWHKAYPYDVHEDAGGWTDHPPVGPEHHAKYHLLLKDVLENDLAKDPKCRVFNTDQAEQMLEQVNEKVIIALQRIMRS